MTLHWPQIVWFLLAFVVLALTAALHGEPMTGKHNFPMRLTGVLFSTWLLWCGGFFG